MRPLPPSAPTLRPCRLLWLVLAGGLAGGWGAEAGAALATLPNGAEAGNDFTGESHLLTSLPSTFTGVDVGELLGADSLYDRGITGQNTIVANIEAGHIWRGHETLGHVTSFVNAADTYQSVPGQPEYDRHATWVGMMIGGRATSPAGAPVQTGIAPGTDLRSGAVATGWVGNAYAGSFNLSVNSFITPYAAFFGTADVINSSWGGADPGGSSLLALIPDALQWQNPTTTFVAAAGNAGPGGNSVGSPGAGYNVLTVGALANNGANVYNSVASFSSRGPNDFYNPVTNVTITGVRAAVDIAAPGTALTSAYYGGQTGGNNPSLTGSTPSGGPATYSGGLQGTSFAAPITAGAAALLVSGGKADPLLAGNADARDARVIKAVLLNSADKLPGWNNGQQAVNGVIQTTQALDWASGAGALNIAAADAQYLGAGTRDLAGSGGGSVAATGWDFGAVGLGGYNTYVIDTVLYGGSTFTVTLDWFRARAFNGTDLYDLGQANLDLVVRAATGGSTVAQSISLYNLVEHLSFTLPVSGRYLIDVRYTGNTFGALALEEYALAWTGVPAPAPLPATLLLVLPGLGLLPVPARRRHTGNGRAPGCRIG